MSERFQFAEATNPPAWPVGRESFDPMWERAYDLLRFHKGAQFTVDNVENDAAPKQMPLRDVKAFLEPRLETRPLDTKFRVHSLEDGYTLAFRRHKVDDPKGELVLAHEKNKIGTPYVFGVTDCSWLTMYANGLEGVELPHNAHLQHLKFGNDAGFLEIQRAQVMPGDLIFHHDDDHVSTYLGQAFGYECVIDTEPHDTGAPTGWPTPNLRTGVQVRPMVGNYYCSWNWVNGIGRIVAINGNP